MITLTSLNNSVESLLLTETTTTVSSTKMSGQTPSRSRTVRKKKCDEQWDRAGICTRCRVGKYTCVKESTRPSRSRRELDRPATPNLLDESSLRPVSSQQLSDQNPPEQPTAGSSKLPSTLESSTVYPLSSLPSLQSSSYDQGNHNNSFSVSSLQSDSLSNYPLIDFSPLPSFLFPTGFESDLSLPELLGTIDASSSRMEALPSLLLSPRSEAEIQQIYQNERYPNPNTTSTTGSKEPSNPSDSGEQKDRQFYSMDVFSSVNAAPFISRHAASPQQIRSDVAGFSAVQPEHSGQDDLSTHSSEDRLGASTLIEMREFANEWWTFYNSLNESYFSSIPIPARTIVKKYMFDSMLTAHSDVNRGAISAWCSSHYSMLLAKERNPAWEEWHDKAGRYYQQTVLLLEDKAYGLKNRLGAVLDLRLAQIDRHGTTPAYFLLLTAQEFLRELLGPDHLEFDFGKTATVESLAFRAYIYSDVFRTVALSKRRTFFRVFNDTSPTTYAEDGTDKLTTVNERTLSVHLGLPAELLCCFAEISNAVVDESEARNADPERIQSKVNAIKTRIEAFESDAVLARNTAGPGNSAEVISDLATQETWRHAALIYLFSSLAQLGSLALPLRQSLSQILLLSSSLSQPSTRHPASNIFRSSSRNAIWFLASTIAVTETDREACRQGLLEGERSELDREQLRAVERLWREVDEKGVAPACWREFLEEQQMKVGFFI
ncbi:Protein of unknown function DUF3468 [Phaffia rhodozyma]|uniref:Uncharacterized protein n=1 Tax=Phaffia rhodozyma TaxID=264483 RepID=A0A0F7SS65_PHARH|nr:Protein of unknown function DUF3468 [Phaffia rhodozyma]